MNKAFAPAPRILDPKKSAANNKLIKTQYVLHVVAQQELFENRK